MTVQLCTAPHRDNPPAALGGLLLCPGHYRGLVEALTGPSAADDPTIDCLWGVRAWGGIAAQYDTRVDAERAWNLASDRWWYLHSTGRLAPGTMPLPRLVAGDGHTWHDPADYRPGGLTRDWAALALRDKTQRTGDPAPYVTGAAEAPLPIDDRLADLRSQILHDLNYWVREHAARLGTQPQFGGSVHQHVTWLARYTDWSAAQDFAGDYVAVLLELRARARHAVDLPMPRPAQVGPCPQRSEGQRCQGTLWSNIREERDPRPSEVRCDSCGETWDSTQWLRLGMRVDAIMRRPAA